jgi:hypothetical protein
MHPLRVPLVAAAALAFAAGLPALAQAPPGWQAQTSQPEAPAAPPPKAPPANTTEVPRSPSTLGPSGKEAAEVSLSAYLTVESQPIPQGLVWRVFREKAGADGKPTLIATHRKANPTLRLAPGGYLVNVAYGRANLTRRITVAAAQGTQTERFVLNAGGLRLIPVLADGQPASLRAVTFDIQSDERDAHGERMKVVTGAKAGVVLRLNAGLYSIVSTYGDANAVARAEVSVEAGKLSEVTLSHAAAKVSFKLVTRSGGDAVADTQWIVTTAQGEPVKESTGALPTHILAPGAYVVRARHAGRTFRREFSVRAGDAVAVEVVMP